MNRDRWVPTLVAFVASAGMVLAGRRWRQRIATFVGAALLFQFLTFFQPSLLVGALLVVVLCAAVWMAQSLSAGFCADPREGESGEPWR